REPRRSRGRPRGGRAGRSRAPPPRLRSGSASRRSPCRCERNVQLVEWRERYERAAARYAGGETRDPDERQLVQLANAAWGAGLSLLMVGDREDAREWLLRAAARYRESWDAGGAPDAWGRPIGAMKALLIAGADPLPAAHWTLEADAAIAESPIARYAA